MNLIVDSILYGTNEIQFQVKYVKRKTLEISVHPNTSVAIKAPVGTDLGKIRKIISKRAKWIIKQQRYFYQFIPRTPARQYISGETHLYLGKQYRLKIKESNTNSVKLMHGCFHVLVKSQVNSDNVKKILNQWYLKKTALKIKELSEECWCYFKKMSVEKPVLQIRKMKNRWGSLSNRNVLTLNSNLIRASKECIKYVIIHEFCHLKYHGHSVGFYDLLEKLLPNWKKIKYKLEERMA